MKVLKLINQHKEILLGLVVFISWYGSKNGWFSDDPQAILIRYMVILTIYFALTIIEKIVHKVRSKLPKSNNIAWKDRSPNQNEKTVCIKNRTPAAIHDYSSEQFIISLHSGNWRNIIRFVFSRGLFSGILITAGWALSPISFYNDAFVNIPISLFLTKMTHHFFKFNPVITMGFFYVFTNVMGFVLMFLGARNINPKRWGIPKKYTLFKLILFLIISMLVASTLHHIFK